MALEIVDLVAHGHPHRSFGAVDHVPLVDAGTPEARVLAKSGSKDAAHAPLVAARAVDAVVHGHQIRSGPETALEVGGIAPRVGEHAPLAKDERPRHDGGDKEDEHDKLDDDARAEHEPKQREIDTHPEYPLSGAARTRSRISGLRTQAAKESYGKPAPPPPGGDDTGHPHDRLNHEFARRSRDRPFQHQTCPVQPRHCNTRSGTHR